MSRFDDFGSSDKRRFDVYRRPCRSSFLRDSHTFLE